MCPVPRTLQSKSGRGCAREAWRLSEFGYRLAAALTALIIVAISSISPAEARRVALVIGNSSYAHVPVLPNPKTDATDIANALEAMDFEVTLKTDLGENEMESAISDFGSAAVDADLSILYFAGHGVGVNNQNYLIPVDATLSDHRQVIFQTVPLNNILASLQDAKGIRMIFLDACRNNPFRSRMEISEASRSIGFGLSKVEAPDGTVISFAAEEGKEAADGLGRNSPFARALLKHIATPGLELQFLLRKVRDEVKASSGGRQVPYIAASLPSEPVYLVAPPDDTSAAGSAAGTQTSSHVAADYAFTERIGTREAWEAFLVKYTDGQGEDVAFYARLARAALDKLTVAPNDRSEIVLSLQHDDEKSQPAVAGKDFIEPAIARAVIEGEEVDPSDHSSHLESVPIGNLSSSSPETKENKAGKSKSKAGAKTAQPDQAVHSKPRSRREIAKPDERPKRVVSVSRECGSATGKAANGQPCTKTARKEIAKRIGGSGGASGGSTGGGSRGGGR